MKKLRAVLLALVAATVALPSYATERDPAVRKSFQKTHPCPANHQKTGPCPGYVVDHIKPLCAGAPHVSFNRDLNRAIVERGAYLAPS